MDGSTLLQEIENRHFSVSRFAFRTRIAWGKLALQTHQPD
jgi:hypothetical protein